MRIFNADGSEAEMCGNGARCFARYIVSEKREAGSGKRSDAVRKLSIQTKAGIVRAEVRGEDVKVNLTDPRDLRLDVPLEVYGRKLSVDSINTGVPHAVVFVEGLDGIDVKGLGAQIRYHKRFAPAGTNVNFIEVESRDSIRIRTYERGVEDETLACGTGSTASALISALKVAGMDQAKIRVITASKEVLTIYFEPAAGIFRDVWLEGKARIVYQGVYYV
jgi:diaminopimelate epimerase